LRCVETSTISGALEIFANFAATRCRFGICAARDQNERRYVNASQNTGLIQKPFGVFSRRRP
jgi:hypothetical protein